jgi:hypothetical protein
MVWCYEVRKEYKGKYMKGIRYERRNEEQGSIVKLAFNEGPTHQKRSKHSARKQKEGRNTGYGSKVGKGRWAGTTVSCIRRTNRADRSPKVNKSFSL